MTKVMVALDGSERSELALPHAQVRLQIEDELYLVQAIEGPEAPAPGAVLNPVVAEAQALAKSYLQSVAERIHCKHVETMVVMGDPRREISRAASRVRADLLVLCSHGRTGPVRWVLGSVAEAVSRESPCPCLLVNVRHPRHPLPAVASRILVALSRTPRSEETLAYVRKLVCREVRLFSSRDANSGQGAAPEASLLQYLETLAEPLRQEGFRVTCQVAEEAPAGVILELARSQHFDLIVMYTQGRRGWQRFLLGSVAEEVARHSPCPVLLVHEEVT